MPRAKTSKAKPTTKKPKKCPKCKKKFIPPPGPGRFVYCDACKTKPKAKAVKAKAAKKNASANGLEAEAEAMLLVALAIEPLEKPQVKRIITWMESTL